MANPNPSPKTRWAKGQSGNLTGRPRGDIAERARERLMAGDDLLDVAFDIAHGRLKVKKYIGGLGPRVGPDGELVEPPYVEVEPDHTERLAAVKTIWERAYGKPQEYTHHSGEIAVPAIVEGVVFQEMTDAALAAADQHLTAAYRALTGRDPDGAPAGVAGAGTPAAEAVVEMEPSPTD